MFKKATSRKPRCPSAGPYPLYLQFKPIIWAQSYPRKYTNCTTPLQGSHFSSTFTSCRKTAVVLKLRKVIFAKFFTSTAKTWCWLTYLIVGLQLMAVT